MVDPLLTVFFCGTNAESMKAAKEMFPDSVPIEESYRIVAQIANPTDEQIQIAMKGWRENNRIEGVLVDYDRTLE